MIYDSICDIGSVRQENQDSIFISDIFDSCALFVVCDGMGGAKGGKTASNTACEYFSSHVINDIKNYINSVDDISDGNDKIIRSILENACKYANSAVFRMACSNSDLSGMGTTMVAALVIGKHVFAINVGDSRLYKVNSSLTRITRDHSYVQTLVDSGTITEEEALVHPQRNIITRAIGTSDNVSSDVFTFDLSEGDSLLLCSDGLCGYVPEKGILSAFDKYRETKDIVSSLFDRSKESGGYDNVSIIVVTY